MTQPANDSAVMIQLTAYLDGELGGQEISDVEERLATDDEFRQTLQKMQQTWDVLDALPTVKAKASFTQSTMELMIDDASQQLKQSTKKSAGNYWLWPLRIVAFILVPAAAAAGAFLAKHYVQDAPNRELERDLQQIRDFDIYNRDKNVSLDFLASLEKEPTLFGVTAAAEMANQKRFQLFSDPPQVLADLSNLDTESKDQLRVNRANFKRASDEDLQRVSQLIGDIESQPDADQLKRVMYQYVYWLDSITEIEKAELFDLKDPELRIAKIKQIVEEQIFNNFALQLPKSDFANIRLMLLYIVQQKKDLIDRIYWDNPKLLGVSRLVEIEWDTDRKKNLPANDRDIYRTGLQLKELSQKLPESIDLIIPREDLQRAKSLLSLEAKTELALAQQWQASQQSEASLLVSWVIAVYDAVYNKVTPNNLIDVFNSLPRAQQDRLNNELPADREKMLRKIYAENYNQDA